MKFTGLRTTLAAGVLALAVGGLATLPATAASARPAAPAAASASDDLGSLTSDVHGTYTDATGGTGTFTGTFVPSQFSAVGDRVMMLNGAGTASQIAALLSQILGLLGL
ncbi:hypothetical protein [Rugosimonospora africana]|uniref:Secreted protein n=1 Tax=Rugosimonospora africana TaxID=556532 RepID=A0A8J3QNJ1_9ACTN|nr:hypothetical protein [Rugosimonospora africana]GIH14253.1 hypothetical protein Raf01_24250 [Rugosimonospora africana]